MPYASKAQAGYFHANKAKLESQGVDVDEYDAASKGKKLPDRAPSASAPGNGHARLRQALITTRKKP